MVRCILENNLISILYVQRRGEIGVGGITADHFTPELTITEGGD